MNAEPVVSVIQDWRSSSFRRALQQLVNQRLIWLGLPGGEAAELSEQSRSDANRDELFGVAGLRSAGRTAHASCAAQFFGGGLRDVRKIDAAICNTPCALCGWRGAR